MASLTVGVDVGGTKIGAGLVTIDGQILQRVKISSPTSSSLEMENAIVAAIQEVTKGYEDQVEAVGIGAAGYVSSDRDTMLFGTNLSWRNELLGTPVSKRVGLPVVVENDANVVAWSEYRFGAGKGYKNVVALTIGTGIGAGIVLDGKLFRGAFGVGAEIGHMCLVRDGRPCACGQFGCWEQYGSGSALVLEIRSLAKRHPERCENILNMAGGDPDKITGLMVSQAAAAGDETASYVLHKIAWWNGIGLANTASVLDPEIFVVGGGVAECGELVMQPMRFQFRKHLPASAYHPIPRIEVARMGQGAGIVGAADLARFR